MNMGGGPRPSRPPPRPCGGMLHPCPVRAINVNELCELAVDPIYLGGKTGPMHGSGPKSGRRTECREIEGAVLMLPPDLPYAPFSMVDQLLQSLFGRYVRVSSEHNGCKGLIGIQAVDVLESAAGPGFVRLS